MEQQEHTHVSQERDGWFSPNYAESKAIPMDMELARQNRCIALHPSAVEVDAYRLLRTRILQKTPDGQGVTVMITSPSPGDGKTLTAINLALTFAKEFRQTSLLVDCDLRQQSVHTYLGIHGTKGLVDYLLHGCDPKELFVWPGVEKLTVISGERTYRESTELLNSPNMEKLVIDMKQRYPNRYIFFDMQSLLGGTADALAFTSLVDFIVLVVHEGKTRAADLTKAISMVPREKILGVVLNRHRG